MTLLSVKSLCKSFGAVEVLRGVDFTVDNGEFVCILGPSGCGKSTLLRCIAGLETASSGEIDIDGRRMTGVAPAERNIAMVFQSYALYPHLSVRRNMGFGLRLQGLPRADIEARVTAAAKSLHIDQLLERKPRQLSGGQRQRVAIGRAIVRDPALFLFDEPLSNLDATLRVEMRQELIRLHRRLGRAMIFVTHDQVEAMTLSSKVIVLNNGVAEQVGAPLDLYHRPANRFVARFIGAPRMNVLPAALLPKAIPGAAEFGIRPEHIRIDQHSARRARVKEVEQLGVETIAFCDADGHDIVVRAEGSLSLREGEQIGLTFLDEKLHFFDAAGRRMETAEKPGKEIPEAVKRSGHLMKGVRP